MVRIRILKLFKMIILFLYGYNMDNNENSGDIRTYSVYIF